MTRAIAGAVLLGAAVWCAAGRVAVASADSASIRIVAPAPWWWLIAGVALALVVPRLRRDLRFALPALLATVPWWPVPLPAVALAWTGPLAWLPIGLAVVAAWGSEKTPDDRSVERVGGRGAWRAGALTALIAIGAGWSVAPHLPGGDEPHYLAIAQSLIRDGDLRIENNHHDPDYVAAFGDLKPDYIVRGRDGAIYSIHAPGAAAIVAPAFAMAGYRGAQATVVLLAAVAGAFVWLAACRAARDRRAAWFAWAAIVGSATFVLQSVMVFPDMPGACAVAIGAWAVVRLADSDDGVRPAVVVLASVALAALPWLHTRFAILAAGLGAVLVWQLLADSSRPAGDRVRRVAAFAAIPAVSAVAWLAYFAVIYGTLNPAAPYGDTSGPDGTHLSYAPGGLTGLLLDGQFGLFAYAPVLALGLVAAARPARDRVARASVALLAVGFAYLVVSTTYWMWWVGVPATPARLATAVLPLLAVPLARFWAQARPAIRALLGVGLVLSLATTAVVVGVGRGDLAWNFHDAEPAWLRWIGPIVNLARGWPSFFWRLDPGHLWSELPFVAHAAAWVIVMAAGWLVVGSLATRRGWSPATTRLAVAWTMVASLTVTLPMGWWLTGARPLDPARAQLGVLADAARGNELLRIDAWSVRRLATLAGAMRIAPNEVGPEGSPDWARWSGVPAGIYQVHVAFARPRAGRIRVTLGGVARTFDLQPMSEQSVTVEVPGRTELAVAPDEGWRGRAGSVELRPLAASR